MPSPTDIVQGHQARVYGLNAVTDQWDPATISSEGSLFVHPATFAEFSAVTMQSNNSATAITGVDVKDYTIVCASIVSATGGGSVGCGVFRLQVSLDNTTFYDTAYALKGPGIINNAVVSARYIRVKNEEPTGTSGLVSIAIQVK